MVEEPVKALRLASAALFREEDGVLRRSASIGWDAEHLDALTDGKPPLAEAPSSAPFPIAPGAAGAPDDLARPVLGVPVGNPRRRFAVVLYSAHESGTDSNSPERALLGALARDAEIAYGQVEREILQKRVDHLEGLLGEAAQRG